MRANPEPVEPDVDIVVTHYEDEPRLAWVLDALAAQTYPAAALHVVVADDGSSSLPSTPPGVRVVTQADEGFRAAAARNLGAAQGDSQYVLFLDGDTVPEPGWVSAMISTLIEAEGDAENRCGALVTGRRRHADLAGLEARAVSEWLANPAARPAERMLDDPRWLLDGHARTRDLRAAGPDDWRLVISAVMGVSRDLFTAIGGLDETLVGYGGEDWDLAYRAWNAGAEFRHAPTAIAWHDGADAVTRSDFADLKEGEQMALAMRVPQPSVRGRHGVFAVPRVVVEWQTGGVRASVEYAALESWLGLGDVGIWAIDADPAAAASIFTSPLAADPRVHLGPVPADVASRAQIVVTLREACLLSAADALIDAVTDAPIGDARVTVATTRQRNRGESLRAVPAGLVEPLAVAHARPLDLESYGRRRWS